MQNSDLPPPLSSLVNIFMNCKTKDCDRERYARSWCRLHYSRWWRYGNPEIVFKRGITPRTERIIDLHLKGKSTAEIAKIYKMKKNTVIQILRYWGKLRPALGIETEKEVIIWLKNKGYSVKRMRGDWYYDAKVNGKKVDIKSSSLHIGKKAWGYKFELHHKESFSGNRERIDYYLLVLKDGINETIYKLNADLTSHLKSSLSIPPDPLNSRKYPLEYIGYL